MIVKKFIFFLCFTLVISFCSISPINVLADEIEVKSLSELAEQYGWTFYDETGFLDGDIANTYPYFMVQVFHNNTVFQYNIYRFKEKPVSLSYGGKSGYYYYYNFIDENGEIIDEKSEKMKLAVGGTSKTLNLTNLKFNSFSNYGYFHFSKNYPQKNIIVYCNFYFDLPEDVETHFSYSSDYIEVPEDYVVEPKPTATPTPTNTPTPTETPTPTPTESVTPIPTELPTPLPTYTPIPTATPTPRPTATPSPTPPPFVSGGIDEVTGEWVGYTEFEANALNFLQDIKGLLIDIFKYLTYITALLLIPVTLEILKLVRSWQKGVGLK